jgi:hypothetical protein
MSVPVSILLANERMRGFRHRLEILRDHLADDELEYHLYDEMEEIQLARPVIFRALQWANQIPPPPITALRETRSFLQRLLDEWGAALVPLATILAGLRPPGSPAARPSLWLALDIAKQEYDHFGQLLNERWPVEDEENEQRAVAEMQSGGGLELDDAFAQIAGVSPAAWQQRVGEHRNRRK